MVLSLSTDPAQNRNTCLMWDLQRGFSAASLLIECS
jgi:hypothetical protein